MDPDAIANMDVEEMLSMYNYLQAHFAEALISDSISLEAEVMARANMAQMGIGLGSQLRRQSLLEDAIRHLDTLLRRIPHDSSHRLSFLNELCEAEYELYSISGSGHSLDESILHGRQANRLSTLSGLDEQDLDLHLEILTNLGHSLVKRFELKKNPRDLEDSISGKREILCKAPKGSERYLTTVNNLASSLRLRYHCTEDDESEQEADELFRELLSLTPPGSQLHCIAVGQLGVGAAMKFRRKKTPEVLDEAIANCNIGMEAYAPGYDGWMEMLEILVELWTEKVNYTGDPRDMKALIDNSCRLFDSIPADHRDIGDELFQHLERLRGCAFKVKSVDMLMDISEKCSLALNNITKDSLAKTRSQLEHSHILGHIYAVTGNVEDLIHLVTYALTVSADYNSAVRASSSLSSTEVHLSWYPDMISKLQVLAEAPPENDMRRLAEEELLAVFKSHYDYDAQKYAFKALDQLQEFNNTRLRILVQAVTEGWDRKSFEVDEKIAELRIDPIEPVTKHDEREPKRPASPNPFPFFDGPGQRLVNIDPRNGHMVFDIKDYVKTLIGQDDGPSSPSQAVGNDERLEQKLVRRAREEGRDINPGLCYWCQWLYTLLEPGHRGIDFDAEDSVIPSSGNWRTILFRKSECAVCDLAASLITTEDGRLHAYFDKMDEDAKRIRFFLGRLAGGEGVLRVDVGLSWAGELRVLTPVNFRQALRQAWEVDGDDSNVLETLTEGTEGPVHDKGGQQIDLKLMRRWLKECDHNHGPSCNRPRPGKRIQTEIDLIFIDVVDERLVSGTSSDDYFVLSYTWGRVEMCMTLSDNLQTRQRPQALSSLPFPKTIRDAMKLVRSVGERLLWIDAICIVQDDHVQKRRDIPNMDIVYGRAYATLVALTGSDADAGLPGVSSASRICQQVKTIDIVTGDGTPSQKCKLVRSPSPLPLALQASTWNTRGWTLQERLLSRRCIYLSADAFHFECNRGILTEGGVNEEYTSYSLGEALDDRNIRQRPKQNNPISDLTHLYDLPLGPRLWGAWNVYRELVEMYAKRQFTVKADVLDGFAGVFAVLDELHLQNTPNIKSTATYGLPEELFVHALLWTPAARITRRKASVLPPQTDVDTAKPDPRFPSWSWAGWDGAVDYRLFNGIEDEHDRPVALVSKLRLNNRNIYPDMWQRLDDIMQHRMEKSTPTVSNVVEERLSENLSPKPADEDVGACAPCKGGDQKGIDIGSRQEDPSLANIILEMTAPIVPLGLFSVSSSEKFLCLTDQVHTRGPQSVRRILDSNGDHCGLWWSGSDEEIEGDLPSDHGKKKMLVGISAHGVCHRPLLGPRSPEGPIPLWDSDRFPEVGEQSGWVNIMVIDEDAGYGNGLANRYTVAIIHKMAWEAAQPVQKGVRVV